jgi:hypothetical protein
MSDKKQTCEFTSIADVTAISADMTESLKKNTMSPFSKRDIANIISPVENNDSALTTLSLNSPHLQTRRLDYPVPEKIIDVVSPSTSSDTSDNVNRQELLWTKKIESKLSEWHENCINIAKVHNAKSKKHRKVFYVLGIPAAIIPMGLAAASEILGDDWKGIVISLLIFMGILNIVSGFLNPGKRAEAHLQFEALYNELAVEITSELVKPQRNRLDADVFIQKIMDKYNGLNNRAPPT